MTVPEIPENRPEVQQNQGDSAAAFREVLNPVAGNALTPDVISKMTNVGDKNVAGLPKAGDLLSDSSMPSDARTRDIVKNIQNMDIPGLTNYIESLNRQIAQVEEAAAAAAKTQSA